MIAKKIKPTNAWTVELDDWCDGKRQPYTFGIVRCPDGDMEAWARHSSEVLNWAGADADTQIQDPVWGWWRWNPDPTKEYFGLLAEAKGPGRGNWRGAKVIAKAVAP